MVLASLKGHTKRVNHVAFCERDGKPTLVLSAGADKITRVWTHDAASGEYQPRATIRTHEGDLKGLGVHPTLTLVVLSSCRGTYSLHGEYQPRATIRTHKGDLTGLGVHPTSTLVVLSSLDRMYSLHELSGKFTQVYHSAAFKDPFTALGIHPEEALLALGMPMSKIQICDIRTGGVAVSILPPESTTGPFTINMLSFPESGYHLLAPDSLLSVAVWDLHKMKVAHSIALGDSFEVNSAARDDPHSQR